MGREWSIQQTAKRAGITSRTLRHYDAIGLRRPSSTGAGGARWYDGPALVRLQRILLLRETGLELGSIRAVLDQSTDLEAALAAHLGTLERERRRLDRQVASIEATLHALQNGDDPMSEHMFDGFDHTAHREEVTERWGAAAYARSSAWWEGMTVVAERTAWRHDADGLAADWRAASAGDPGGADAQALAARHVAWLRSIPGTPAADPDGDLAGYVRGLGEMYVADPRFAATYGGAGGAAFVRDALSIYVRTHL